MTNLIINEVSLRDAVIEYFEATDRNQCHVHLRIKSDGTAYVSEDTGYCISEAEFNKVPGHTITVRHQSGNGQCELEEGWHQEDEGVSAIEDMVEAIITDLSRDGYECELV